MGIIFLGLIIIIIVFTFRNIVLIRDLAISKEYKKIYKSVVESDPEAITKINEYLKNESNEYLLSKTNVLLMYLKLQKRLEVGYEVHNIKFEDIFLNKGKYSTDFVNLNSDMMIWTVCCLPRLNGVGQLYQVKEKLLKLNDTLANHIEYRVFCGAFAVLTGDEEGSKFLYDLVNGDYPKLNYDKQLISVTKRIALAYIASKNKEKNIEYADELNILSKTMIGRNILTDLGIYEIYK